MNKKIFIPEKINVGFQNRKGTYTGNLGYVTYYDEKGILRKSTSWNKWRDKNIPNKEFENIAIEGFELNKNNKSTFFDIYANDKIIISDPRGFEFEITLNNLFYLLKNCNIKKNKGIEGKLIYGWRESVLVLLPIKAPDYKTFFDYSKARKFKTSLTAKDLKEGATYLTNENEELIYIGRFNYCLTNNIYEKSYVFYDKKDDSYIHCTTLNKKIIKCIKNKTDKDFYDLLEGIKSYSCYISINN